MSKRKITHNRIERFVNQTPEDNFPKAVFEMFELLDEKVTKINNKFDRMAKELGYEN